MQPSKQESGFDVELSNKMWCQDKLLEVAWSVTEEFRRSRFVLASQRVA
jgi:hypothetical protein